MAKKLSAGSLISPTNLWGKPLPTTKQVPDKSAKEKVTGKMTDSDDVMDDEEIDVDAELENADVEEDEHVTAEAEEELGDDVDGDEEDDSEEAADEEPEYDDDVKSEVQDAVEDDEEVVTAVADDESEEEEDEETVSTTNEDVSVMAEKMSLSDHVRAEIDRRHKAGDSLRGVDIVNALAKRKIEVSAAQVSQLLKKAGLGGKPRGKKAAVAATAGGEEKSRSALKAKKREPAAPAAPVSRPAAKARPAATNGFRVPMTQLQAAEAFVDACGGSFKDAERILTAAAQLSQTFGS